MAVILITGGTGLIGSALTEYLTAKGHEVRHLSRSRGKSNGIARFHWDVKEQVMDDAALIGTDHILHLAGAGIADKRWTRSRVKELIESRTASARLLLDRARALHIRPASFISAAGINYYGAVTTDHIFKETDPPGNDTIAHISKEWERAVDEWRDLCRVVKLRTPVVLAAKGGALPKLATPVRYGIGAPLGKGTQWFPWVHVKDLVRIYAQAIDDSTMEGAYNAGALGDTTNASMMRTIAKVLGKPFFIPAVPAFALKLALGDLSSVLLEGSRAHDQRLLSTGYKFEFAQLEPALQDLLRRA